MNMMSLNDSITADDLEEDRIGKEIVDAAFFVHKTFGPGLLENLYEGCFVKELRFRKLHVENQKMIPVYFRGEDMGFGYKMDALVENKVIIEMKAVEKLMPVHQAQLLTYMKLADIRLGYLINFNVPLIRDGIKRIVRRK